MARSISAIQARKRRRIRVRPHSGEISVYQKGSRLNGPAPSVPVTVAQEWIDLGVAEPVNRGTGIQLRVRAVELRGLSCRVNARTAELAAMGVLTALLAAESYRGALADLCRAA